MPCPDLPHQQRTFIQPMLLQGYLSYATDPVPGFAPVERLAVGMRLSCWPAGSPTSWSADVQDLPEGALRVGETKRTTLVVQEVVIPWVLVGDVVWVGTTYPQALGRFIVQAIASEPALAVPAGQPAAPALLPGFLTESEQQLLVYIQEWVRQADWLCSTLRDTFNLDFTRVPRVERNALLGRHGAVQGIHYAFHGIGCGFKTTDLQLEVDFDSQGNWCGFDLLRLQWFVEWNYPESGFSPQRIQQDVTALLQKGWLYRTSRPSDSAFYYVTPTPSPARK